MECRFKYLSEKLHIKHLYKINFKNNFPKRNFFKIMFFFMYGMKIWMKKKILKFFRHLTDTTYDICDNFMDKTINIWISLHVWNLTDATYNIWHKKALSKKYVL